MGRRWLLAVPVLLAVGLLVILLGSGAALAGDISCVPITPCLLAGFSSTPTMELLVHETLNTQNLYGVNTPVYDLWYSIPISPGYTRVTTQLVTFRYSWQQNITFAANGAVRGTSGALNLYPPGFSTDLSFYCRADNQDQVDANEASWPDSWGPACNTASTYMMGGAPSNFQWTNDGPQSDMFDWPAYPVPSRTCLRNRDRTINYHFAQDGQVFWGNRDQSQRLYFSFSTSDSDPTDASQTQLLCTLSGFIYLPGPMATPTPTPTLVVTGTPVISPTMTPVTGTTGTCIGIACPPSMTPAATMVPHGLTPAPTMIPQTPDPIGLTVGAPSAGACYTLLPQFQFDQWLLQWHVAFNIPEQRLCINERSWSMQALGFDWSTFATVLLVGVASLGVVWRVVKGG